MKPGNLIRIISCNYPYLFPDLDLTLKSPLPVLHLGEVGIILEPMRDTRVYGKMCKVITRYGAGWVNNDYLEVVK